MPRKLLTLKGRRGYLLVAVLWLTALAGCATAEQDVGSGLWHFNAGLYNQAIPLLVSGVESVQKSNPGDDRLPRAFEALGVMASAEKRYDIAERYFKREIECVEKYHGADATLVRNAAVRFGSFLSGQGRFREAIPLLTRAAQISITHASSNTLYAIDLDNLSSALAGDGQLAESDAMSDKALAALDDLPQDANTLSTRGVVFFNRAYRFAEHDEEKLADSYYRKAMADIANSPERWRVKVVRENYSKFLRKMGRTSEAESVEQLRQ